MYSNFSMIRISNDIIDIIDAPYYSNHFGAWQEKKTRQEIRTNFPILNEKNNPKLMQFRWNKRKIYFDLMNGEGKCAYWKRKQPSINYESTHLTVSWLVNYFNCDCFNILISKLHWFIVYFWDKVLNNCAFAVPSMSKLTMESALEFFISAMLRIDWI